MDKAQLELASTQLEQWGVSGVQVIFESRSDGDETNQAQTVAMAVEMETTKHRRWR
jgi:hypothetical protein